jgi:hypothetical protein
MPGRVFGIGGQNVRISLGPSREQRPHWHRRPGGRLRDGAANLRNRRRGASIGSRRRWLSSPHQHRIIEPDAWGLIPRKLAFSNRYDCEVFPVGMKTGIECQALTFAQVQARASGRESDRCECWSVGQTDAARIRMRDERRAFRRPW